MKRSEYRANAALAARADARKRSAKQAHYSRAARHSAAFNEAQPRHYAAAIAVLVAVLVLI